MATITFYFDTRHLSDNNTHHLKIYVNLSGRKVYVNTGIHLEPSQWRDGVIVNHQMRAGLNTNLQLKYGVVYNAVLELENSRKHLDMKPAQIKRHLEGILNGSEGADYTLIDHFRYFISIKDRTKTISSYQSTLDKIISLGGEVVYFPDITPAWLREFEGFLKKQGLATNTIAIHMRNLRAVINNAIDEDKTSLNNYPFRRFKIKSETTRKRSLTIQQLIQLRDFDSEPHMRQYIDIFMLIFYLRGINIIDLCNLDKITNGYIEYRRAKTGKLYTVKVEPEAMEIIERYRGTKYLLNILDRYGDYNDYLRKLNRNLKLIGDVEIVERSHGKLGKKQYTPLFSDISTYWARHTWATVAASLDIPKETIAAGLGHGGNSVTDIYIDFDQSKVDDANRRVIDALNVII